MARFALNVPVLDEEDNTGIYVTEADLGEVPESWRDLGPFAWVFWHHLGHMRIILVEELRIDADALAKVVAFATGADTEPDPVAWLAEGARCRVASSGWPRVRLEEGMEGTVTKIDRDPVTGDLNWVTVVYDNHPEYTDGVHHYGWHVTGKHIIPVPQEGSNG